MGVIVLAVLFVNLTQRINVSFFARCNRFLGCGEFGCFVQGGAAAAGVAVLPQAVGSSPLQLPTVPWRNWGLWRQLR